jgi:hypothetical protein
MLLELTNMIGNRLAEPRGSTTLTANEAVSISASDRPVLQLCSIPIAVTPSSYANPLSSSNPGGTYTSLYAFRLLVDPVPTFTEDYTASASSTEAVFGNVVTGAATVGSTFAQGVLASAQQSFELTVMSGLAGIPEPWRPVYATPADWYDTSQSSRFLTMNLDVSGGEDSDHPFTILGDASGHQPLAWRVGNTAVPLAGGTTLQSVQLRCLQVELTRPWLDYTIFGMNGWYLEGQPAGLCSSGSTTSNGGILPLLPTSILIGMDTTLTAQWSAADRILMDAAVAANEFLALGPFVLQSGAAAAKAQIDADVASAASSQTLFVVGWISALVPLSPPMASPSRSMVQTSSAE